MPSLFAKQFEKDEDNEGSEKAASSEEIHEGVPNGAYDRMYDHWKQVDIHIPSRVVLSPMQGFRSLLAYAIGSEAPRFSGVVTHDRTPLSQWPPVLMPAGMLEPQEVVNRP